MDNLLGTLPHIRQITILGIAAYFMSCGTSANAMSLVTQTSRPTCGKGADVMFGLTALSAGSRLQDLTTTTSIKRRLSNLTMLHILPC